MTGTLPQEVRDVFARFITTEFVTMDASGQPIVWPLTPYYSDGDPVIEVTTGVGYPKKAEDARRNPRVAMLFSDPTGSGIESGIRVLVQGTAEIDDADLGANRERYRRESAQKLPATVEMLPPKLDRGAVQLVLRAHLHPGAPGADLRLARRGGRAGDPRLPHGGGSLGPHRGAGAAALATAARRAGVGRADRGAGRAPPDRRPRLGRPGRLPAGGAGRGPLAWAASAGSRSPTSTPGCRSSRAAPASPPTPTPPTSSGRRTSRSGAICSKPASGWALSPHKLIGGFELPKESELARYRRNLRKSVRFYKTRKRVLRERAARSRPLSRYSGGKGSSPANQGPGG